MVCLVAYLKKVTPHLNLRGLFFSFFSISSGNLQVFYPLINLAGIRRISLIILSKFVPSDSFFTDLHRPVGNKAQGTNFKKLVQP